MTLKLVTKIIMNKIKGVLAKIVAPNQCSFIHGCQITDNIIICQQIIYSLRSKQGRRGGMIIKVDLKKACAGFECSFIQETLQDVRLPVGMIAIIMERITNASFRLLWNREKSEGVFV